MVACCRCRVEKDAANYEVKRGRAKKMCRDCCEITSDEAKAKAAQSRKERKELFGGDKSSQMGFDYRGRNTHLARLGFSTYKDYLLSPLWAEVRVKVFKVKGRSCYLCRGPATQVHHERYHPNDLTGNRVKFLHPVCRPCHEKIEFQGGRKLTVKEVRKKFKKIRRRVSKGISAPFRMTLRPPRPAGYPPLP